MASPTIGKLSSMYAYAWKQGLKTTYYLRSRPATRIAKATVTAAAAQWRRARAPPDAGRERRERRGRLLLGEPGKLRSLPVSRPLPHGRHPAMLLDPGMDLTLRPMRYPEFYERYRAAIRNTWTVEEVDFSSDLADLATMTAAERHLINRLVAFFATGDSIVANNLVLNLYQHVNAPEARPVPSRQLFEEAVHVQFYLTLLDTYLPDPEERVKAFAAVEQHPVDQRQGRVLLHGGSTRSRARAAGDPRTSGGSSCSTSSASRPASRGCSSTAAFAYVYFLRSRGLLNGLAAGTNWVFRDESVHMEFAFEVVDTVRREEPELFDDELEAQVTR